MSVNQLTRNRAAALTLVNRIRVKCGLKRIRKLPPGVIGNPCQCPVARALIECSNQLIEVYPDGISIADDTLRVKLLQLGLRRHASRAYSQTLSLPTRVTMFVRAFDKGEYPDLILD